MRMPLLSLFLCSLHGSAIRLYFWLLFNDVSDENIFLINSGLELWNKTLAVQ